MTPVPPENWKKTVQHFVFSPFIVPCFRTNELRTA